jgi:hypothetical protein
VKDEQLALEETFKDMRGMARMLFPWHKRIGIEFAIFRSRMYLKGCYLLLKVVKKK